MDADSPDRSPGSDEELLALLGETLERVDPVPGWIVEASRRLYELRDPDLDLELASLIADSAVDEASESGGVAVRATALADSAATSRLLTFEAGDLAIEVEVEPSPRGRLVRGQIVPRQELELDLVHRRAGDTDGYVHTGVRTDALGRFELDGVLPGPLRLVCRRPDRPAVATSWVVVD